VAKVVQILALGEIKTQDHIEEIATDGMQLTGECRPKNLTKKKQVAVRNNRVHIGLLRNADSS
jgi:uncharacterized pyridoxal phosphate-containing UPF0001 family protein